MSKLPRPESSCHISFYLKTVAVFLWTAGLVYLSLTPNGAGLAISGYDKVLHFAAYTLMSWLAAHSLRAISFSIKSSAIISIVYSIILGSLVELLQAALTETRSAELGDIIANTIGALLGCAIFCLQEKLKSRRNER
ncbi:MAG: hypothetical protein C0623_10640 [Desulfuromonas sp.]|nr:MAG: hypothetical protein C0623_10640 [Desulfuromonas sp.]